MDETDRITALEAQLARLTKPSSEKINEAPSFAAMKQTIARRQLEQRAEAIRRDRALGRIKKRCETKLAPRRKHLDGQLAGISAELAKVRADAERAEQDVLARRRLIERELHAIDAVVAAEPDADLLAQALAQEPEVPIDTRPRPPEILTSGSQPTAGAPRGSRQWRQLLKGRA